MTESAKVTQALAPLRAALPLARVVKLSGQGHLAHAAAPRQLGRAIAHAVMDSG
jgi:hypothetical protein